MQVPTRTFSTMIVMAVASSLPMLSCHAADRSNSFAETGQPRALVNRPDNWTCENLDELHRCETAHR